VPETEPWSEQFEELGFESRYVLNNMGTMIFFYIAFPFLALLHKCLHRLKKTCSCALKTAKKLRSMLYYSWILTTVFESYSLVSICCLIAYTEISFSSWGLSLQATVCILFTIFFLAAPFVLMRRLSKQMHLLADKKIA